MHKEQSFIGICLKRQSESDCLKGQLYSQGL